MKTLHYVVELKKVSRYNKLEYSFNKNHTYDWKSLFVPTKLSSGTAH